MAGLIVLTTAALVGVAHPLPVFLILGLAFTVGLQGIHTDCGWNAAMRCAGPTSTDARTLLSHSFGIVIGASVAASLVWALGRIVVIPLSAIAIALVAMGALRLWRPTTLAPGGWKVRRL